MQNTNPAIGWLSNGNARQPGHHGFTTKLYLHFSALAIGQMAKYLTQSGR